MAKKAREEGDPNVNDIESSDEMTELLRVEKPKKMNQRRSRS